MRLAISLFLISGIALAHEWSGYLVDSGCWASRQNNVSTVSTNVDRDMEMDLRFCSPTIRTRQFAVLLRDWQSVNLDPATNEKATYLARKASRPRVLFVSMNGALNGKAIHAGSIWATKPHR